MVTKGHYYDVTPGGGLVSRDTDTYYGLSTDSKPASGVGNGSAFIEMDSGTLYFYDAAGAQWIEWGASA